MRFISAMLAAAALISTAAIGATAAEPAPIADGVELLRGAFVPGRQPDGNSVLLQGVDGWVLIDSGRHRAHTEALLARTAGRLRAVVNTHWHLDHLGGNALLRERQPGLVAHASPAVDAALAGWLANSRRQLAELVASDKVPEADKAQMRIDLALLENGDKLAPDRRIDAPVDVPVALELAGRKLRIGVERAVSGGDLWVLDEASGTLMTGDLVTLPVPFMDTACADDWDAALGRLAALPFARIVPGHGPVLDRAAFGRYRAAFAELRRCAADDAAMPAQCAAGWTAALEGLVDASDAPRVDGMLGYYFRTRLRAAADERQRFCKTS